MFVTSREMVAAAQFSVFLAFLSSYFSSWFSNMKAMMRLALVGAFHVNLTLGSLTGLAWSLTQKTLLPLGVLIGVTAMITLAIHLGITKLGFSTKKFSFNLNRFNPGPRIAQLAKQGPMSLLQCVLMLCVFSYTIYYLAKQNAEIFLSLPFASLDVGLQKTGNALKDLLWKAAGVFVVFGAIDLFRQQRSFQKQVRMTKEEVKREMKESESAPEVKKKIKRMARDLSRRKMMRDVPTATAVIVNPTHFAVALKYDRDSMATPMVVAKGQNLIAMRIRQLAIEHGVPLIENPPLARALYKSVEVGQEIPPQLYRAVAEVLAYIYRLTRGRF